MTRDPGALLDALASGHPDLEPTRMFGSAGLKIGGRTFVMVVKGRVVLKLPAARVTELVDTGYGERFDPGHGRLMREWVSLDPAHEHAAEPGLIEEALHFVSVGTGTAQAHRR